MMVKSKKEATMEVLNVMNEQLKLFTDARFGEECIPIINALPKTTILERGLEEVFAIMVILIVGDKFPNVRFRDYIPTGVATHLVPIVGGHCCPSLSTSIKVCSLIGQTEEQTRQEMEVFGAGEIPIISINVPFFRSDLQSGLSGINSAKDQITPELYQDLVNLSHQMSSFSIMMLIAHELRHLWQFEVRGLASHELTLLGVGGTTEKYVSQWIERDAYTFEVEFMKCISENFINEIKRIVG